MRSKPSLLEARLKEANVFRFVLMVVCALSMTLFSFAQEADAGGSRGFVRGRVGVQFRSPVRIYRQQVAVPVQKVYVPQFVAAPQRVYIPQQQFFYQQQAVPFSGYGVQSFSSGYSLGVGAGCGSALVGY